MLVTLDVCGKSRVVVAFALISILNEVTKDRFISALEIRECQVILPLINT